jgi:hypothetical protein
MTTTTRRVALAAWITFAIFTTGSVLADLILPVGVAVLLLLVAMLAWIVLLVVYNRRLAQWRGVLLCWLAFGLLSGALTWLGAGDGILRGVMVSLVAVLCLYALVAGYAALIALVLRRDVSVAYIFIPIAIGALVMLLTVRSVGGVTQWLDALTSGTNVGPSLLLGPLVLSLSCMSMLGFIAIVPYMIITGVREVRGN